MTLSPIYLLSIGTLGIALLTGVQKDLQTAHDDPRALAEPAALDDPVALDAPVRKEPGEIQLVGFEAPAAPLAAPSTQDLAPPLLDTSNAPAALDVPRNAKRLPKRAETVVAPTPPPKNYLLKAVRPTPTPALESPPELAVEMKLAPLASPGQPSSTPAPSEVKPNSETDVTVSNCPTTPMRCVPRYRTWRRWK